MTDKLDYKKKYKDLYLPSVHPSVIDVPGMIFIMADGKGDPNTCREYKDAVEILYGLSYSIKMSKMEGYFPEGYFEYVVPPLEGLWATENGSLEAGDLKDKDKFYWTSMIRQPEFVTNEVFERAKYVLSGKKPLLDLSFAKLVSFNEGLCAQIMHIGPYDNEPETINILEEFIISSGYEVDISGKRRHHEIYLSDPRKTAPEKLKTVIRLPIK